MAQTRIGLLLGLLLISFGFQKKVHASLQVFPTRVLLTDQKKAGRLAIRHLGTKPETYKITPVFYRMLPDGNVQQIDTPKEEDRFAKNMMRFTPRRVTLPPSVEQIVRIIARFPANTPPGDYRAHLYFESVDPPKDVEKTSSKSDKKFEMKLEAKMAVAVPVIIRHGHPKSSIQLEALKIVDDPKGKPSFEASLNSEGEAFPYGDLFLYFTKKGESTPQKIATVKGVSSYVPKRRVYFPIADNEALKNPGKLELIFQNPLEEGGEVLAKTEVDFVPSKKY